MNKTGIKQRSESPKWRRSLRLITALVLVISLLGRFVVDQGAVTHVRRPAEFEMSAVVEDSPNLRTSNYFQRAWRSNHFPLAQELPPFQVMTTYIQQHSQAQLEREWLECQQELKEKSATLVGSNNQTGTGLHSLSKVPPGFCAPLASRKFVVGVYSCPHESGNRLHRFMNSLIWAVATNRTFLWRYYTPAVSLEYNESNYLGYNQSDCDSILELSQWIPSFEQWNQTLGLPAIQRAEIYMAKKTQVRDAFATPYDQTEAPLVIRTGRQFLPDPTGMLSQRGKPKSTRDVKLRVTQPANLERVYKLKSNGVYFLYGMLFEVLFTIQESLLPDPQQISDPTTHDTYFLHSRHPGGHLDGTYTWPELKCLHKFLDHRTNGTTNIANANNKPCTFYLMSDRQISIDLLSTAIGNFSSCNVQTATNRQMGTSFSKEHGPFAGAGYWQDWALAIEARTGFIAYHQGKRTYVRTSTALIREVVEFRRVLEGNFNHNSSTTTTIPIFQQCTNPYKNV